MKNGAKLTIVALLAVAVVATFALRKGKRAEYVPAPLPAASNSAPTPTPTPAAPALPTAPAAPVTAPAAAATPRLLELGSMRCKACLEMAKVLDALRASQGAKLQVDFIDVFEQPDEADRHKITLIPTQILYDSAGTEIFRHTGYFSHDDVLAKFRELGVRL
jgi:thioredoxin 1